MVAVLCERAPITPILPPFPIPLLLTTHSPPHSHSKPSCIQSSIYPWLPACKGIKARSRPTCKCMLLDRSSWKSPFFRTKETEKILKILTNRRSLRQLSSSSRFSSIERGKLRCGERRNTIGRNTNLIREAILHMYAFFSYEIKRHGMKWSSNWRVLLMRVTQ